VAAILGNIGVVQLIAEQDEVLRQIAALNVWKRGEERAPHKPLLILLALGRLGKRLAPFDEWEAPLRRLLEEFGPPRKSVHPEYPFWRLQTDSLWEVDERVQLTRRQGNSDPLKSELIKFSIKGGFPAPIYEAFRRNPLLVRQVAQALLTAHFPASIHEDILSAVGLDLESETKRSRIADFRHEVLETYGHACAFCGYSVRIGNADLGLDAAHIMWHQAKGPDIPANGLACCSLHHRALDRGAISLSDDLTILVSTSIHGGAKLDEHFLSLTGRPLRTPSQSLHLPKPQYLSWHRKEVFRPPPRDR
jgi:putative restriction endonuclease